MILVEQVREKLEKQRDAAYERSHSDLPFSTIDTNIKMILKLVKTLEISALQQSDLPVFEKARKTIADLKKELGIK